MGGQGVPHRKVTVQTRPLASDFQAAPYRRRFCFPVTSVSAGCPQGPITPREARLNRSPRRLQEKGVP
jgi:hypothetical protein